MNRRASRGGSFATVPVLAALCALLALAQAARAETAAPPDKPADVAKTSDAAADDADDLATYGRLDAGIRAAARRDHLPAPVVEALIGIFSDGVDLQQAAHPGDGFVVVTDGAARRSRARDGRILFAALTHGGQTESFYRFTTRRGAVGYFDASGRSADKVLIRRPVRDGTLHGVFGMVRHPILGTTKFHAGVDWEAAAGTPIYASGPGRIESAGWEGGYGKRICLRHPGGYETAYAHLARIPRGIAPGVQVRQGQLIGYVGSTGLSSGPHLHYEVLVDGRFVDPIRIRLPAQRVLRARALAHFERQRERLDAATRRDAAFHTLVAQK